MVPVIIHQKQFLAGVYLGDEGDPATGDSLLAGILKHQFIGESMHHRSRHLGRTNIPFAAHLIMTKGVIQDSFQQCLRSLRRKTSPHLHQQAGVPSPPNCVLTRPGVYFRLDAEPFQISHLKEQGAAQIRLQDVRQILTVPGQVLLEREYRDGYLLDVAPCSVNKYLHRAGKPEDRSPYQD